MNFVGHLKGLPSKVMGLNAGNSSNYLDVENSFGDERVEDAPCVQHLLDDFDQSQYVGIVSSFDYGSNYLSNSVLNNEFNPSRAAESRVLSNHMAQNSATIGPETAVANQNNRCQDRAVITSPRFSTAPSINPSNTSNTITKTPLIGGPLPRPQLISRPSSHLRNEIFPERPIGASASMADHHKNFQRMNSSPANYSIQIQPGPMAQQALQPFHESNVRSSLHQVPSYGVTQHMSQDRSVSQYPDPQNYSLQNPFSDHSYPNFGGQNGNHGRYDLQHQQQQTIMQPMTPPNAYARHTLDHDYSHSSMSESSTDVVKHEGSISGSPLPQVKKVNRKVRRRAASSTAIASDEDSVSIKKNDRQYIEELMDAMTDETIAEDNVGMKNTWSKIREKKADKVRTKCHEMLDLLKRAQHEQLGDKKAVHVYTSFDHRFDEACDALRTQKTVCKHLMEAPYTHTVANDPTYAAQVGPIPEEFLLCLLIRLQRVKNNRRVNGQKKAAITMGRAALGLEGQGKGHKLGKIGIQGLDEALEDGENSADDPLTDEEANSPLMAEIKRETGSHRKTRKTRHSALDDDFEPSVVDSPAPKRPKHPSRSIYKIVDNSQMIDTGNPSSRSNEVLLPPAMGNSYAGFNSPQHPYGPTAHTLPPMNSDYNGPNFDPFNTAWVDCSSGVGPQFPGQFDPSGPSH